MAYQGLPLVGMEDSFLFFLGRTAECESGALPICRIGQGIQRFLPSNCACCMTWVSSWKQYVMNNETCCRPILPSKRSKRLSTFLMSLANLLWWGLARWSLTASRFGAPFELWRFWESDWLARSSFEERVHWRIHWQIHEEIYQLLRIRHDGVMWLARISNRGNKAKYIQGARGGAGQNA